MYYDPYDYTDVYHYSTSTTIIYLIIAIFLVVCMWKIFTKAHEEGWAAIVPFYNYYILFKITWGKGWFFLLLLIPIANLVISIITMVKLAKVFGKGGGFACGLIFLSIVFLPILAFSKDIEYVGIQGKQYDYGPGAAGTWQNPYQQNPNQQNAYQQNPYQQNTYTQTSAQNSNYHYQRAEQPSGFTGKYCPHCGTALEPGSKFCSSCGNRL